MSVSDTVVVLRDGRPAYDAPIGETSSEDIVRRMVGRELLSFERRHPVAPDAEVHFEATGVVHPSGVGPESISVRRGEVVGIAGLVGSGRTEFLRALIRADDGTEGTVRLGGRPLRIRSPRDSRDAGIAFIPEDRKHQGLVLQTPAYANVALTSDRQLNGFGPFISTKRQIETAEEMGRRMSLRPADVRLNARQFSGGNQQKIVIAKWIWLGASVFLFDEPTKGVDVGGKVEIYELIDQLASEGHAVIVVSSDLPEIISISDRVLVMRSGRFVSSTSATTSPSTASWPTPWAWRKEPHDLPETGSVATPRRRSFNLQAFGIYIAAVVLFVILGVLNPNFLTIGNLRDVAVSASVNAIIGIGLTFVIITGGIDLAVGAMASFVGIVSASLMVNGGVPPLLGLAAGIVLGLICGGINGLLVTKLNLPPFIATLGTMSVFQEAPTSPPTASRSTTCRRSSSSCSTATSEACPSWSSSWLSSESRPGCSCARPCSART